MDNKNKILNIDGSRAVNIQKLDKMSDNSGNGGEPPMDKYVTHEELEASTEKILHQMDKHFADMQHQMDKRFNEVDKHFSNIELEIHDAKNTAQNNKEKINWLLYTVVGGIAISVITTIISNLVTK
ncbi:hypothetical protein HCN73_04815 [Lactobacillus crispatus]|uniref:hypothetical protein n=1 Tax=Lactobacillus crispatus TaxID=47770 RepID=UPI0015EB6420|nr:hypothetical protein [Lactobacillus crispatus]MBA2915666.1 hypothetical protein [Lactobacillus crispatus]